MYLAWDVPKCADGCNDAWLGDGFCDKACNVSACKFDWPDCANATEYGRRGAKGAKNHGRAGKAGASGRGGDGDAAGGGGGGDARPVLQRQCERGCPDAWVGDGACDDKCDVAACAFDAGDCDGR